MDFLNRATEKLDVKDKLPDQVKEKIPSSSKGAKGEGSHLSSSNNDEGGFPNGLKPETWMGDLVQKNIIPETAEVTEFVYPGSHDCATYKDGLESFSYQCQEVNLYEQMKKGQRMFDLRLAKAEGKDKFIPVHGIAKNTGDDFAQSEKDANANDIVSQILKFSKEHKSEILVFSTRVESLPQCKKEFCATLMHHLGDRLLEAPQGNKMPTYQQAMQSNRNIIFGLPGAGDGESEKYVWVVGGSTNCWMGNNDPLLWNEPTWQSGEIDKVLKSTEEFIQKHEKQCSQRNKFWVANLQLTPVLGQNITTFFKEGGSIRPRDLALGGGIGTHGSFKGSNKELRESGVLKKPLWTQNASCIIYDFCDVQTTGLIVSMNMGAKGGAKGGAGGGAAGPGARHDNDDNEPKHGKKGGAGGRADDDDDEGKKGHGGGGRGGHGGKRGGHD